MRIFHSVCVLMLLVLGCADEDPSSTLPYQPNQRDMSRPGAEMGMTRVDMFPALDSMTQPRPTDAGMPPMVDAAVGPVDPAFGMLQITEILYDSNEIDDDAGEWIEVQNVSQSIVRLADCVVEDRAAQNNPDTPAALLGSGTLAPGDYVLLARSDDPSVNGGLNPDVVFDFSLSNGGDEIILTCGGIEVDVVAYDDGDTFPNAKGFSILKGIDSRDGSERWCPSTSVYDVATNQRGTPGADNDECAALSGNSCWAQVDCEVGTFCMNGLCGLPPGQCTNNTDCEVGEICVEQRCESEAQCQSNDGCGQGEMCVNNECVEAPECVGNADCLNDQVCMSGTCVPDNMLAQPSPGQVLISELMYDPHGPVDNRLEDDRAEWVELVNVSDVTLDLANCLLSDASDISASLGVLTLAPGVYALGARSALPEENGQLSVDFTFDFALNNTSDTVTLICNGQTIDSVVYTDPTNPAQSFQRSSDDLVGSSTEMTIWCGSSALYLMTPDHQGSPGIMNEMCP